MRALASAFLVLLFLAGTLTRATTPSQDKPLNIAKTATERKIDSRLLLALLHARNDPRVASLTDFRFITPDTDGRIGVDILLARGEGVTPVLLRLGSLGAVIQGHSPTDRRISARVHLEDLEPLAEMPEVRRMREARRAITHR